MPRSCSTACPLALARRQKLTTNQGREHEGKIAPNRRDEGGTERRGIKGGRVGSIREGAVLLLPAMRQQRNPKSKRGERTRNTSHQRNTEARGKYTAKSKPRATYKKGPARPGQQQEVGENSTSNKHRINPIQHLSPLQELGHSPILGVDALDNVLRIDRRVKALGGGGRGGGGI